MKHGTLRRLRSIFLAVLFVVSAGAPSLLNRAQAQETRSGHEFDYYSDDSYSCLVGVFIYCNDGSLSSWGRTSPYSIVSDSGC
ncbi:MAG TPA: hypothetical protein VI685_18755 [Candidatus Angelobacter sp.]